jgi:collagenase-like PrtC family protease
VSVFDVPFVPEDAYLAFLQKRAARLYACHFGLYHPGLADGRCRLRTLPMDRLIEYLRELPGPRKYLVVNSRFQRPEAYRDSRELRGVLERFEALLVAGVLDGIVFADAYYLRALSDAGPSVAAALEALPGVNFMVDTAARLAALLELIQDTRFRLPSKIVLDRSLNRRPGELARVAADCRRLQPGIKVGLLVNEGCLEHCPFKLTHDAHISLTYTGTGLDTFGLNRELGCMRYLREHPPRVLRSPFIRPEDIRRYRETVDFFKICGRTLGGAFLQRVASAYMNGGYRGNLFDLLDALDWLAAEVDLPNQRLPEDFHARLTGCRGDCERCDYCSELYGALARPRPLHLPDLRGVG